jgi:hypothetical protein
VKKKVCGYQWVVQDLCGGCQAKCQAEAPVVAPGAEVPDPPAVNAKVIPGKPAIEKMAARKR